ncbi:hypothetical protein ILYODFUR_001193 [Ilyodon furcidens]|uniref:Uncharacterized protein n=1 Tax=Ilyodon furcidens TaxID=33524 RepID=A0ABV0SHJ9_9TELE
MKLKKSEMSSLPKESSLFFIDREPQAAPGHLSLSLFFLHHILPPHLCLLSAPPTKSGGSKQYRTTPSSSSPHPPPSFLFSTNPLIGGAQVRECSGYRKASRKTQFSTVIPLMSDLHFQIFSVAVYTSCASLSHSCTFKR